MRGPILSRYQLLRSLPKHVLYAILLGAITGILLYWLKFVQLSGKWNYLMFFPIASIYVNGATLPVAIPGRHWTFAFIGAMMMLLLLIAGVILSIELPFSHSLKPGTSKVMYTANLITYGGILTGGCLGLFYGILAGCKTAMFVGLAMGVATGYLLSLASIHAVIAGADMDILIYNSTPHAAWQGALACGTLHIGAGLGAILGSGGGK
ncbi:MAG: hypothetical protein V1899_08975 [Planctomycetota bacterium]